MSSIAAKTQFSFDGQTPALAGADTYVTPSEFAARLGPLALLNYIRGTITVGIRDPDGTATGTVAVSVEAGGVALASLVLSPGQPIKSDIDLSQVGGAQAITVNYDAASYTGNFTGYAVLETETPLIVGGC